MPILSHYPTLFAYHWHTTRRLLDCAAKLSPADYAANPGYGHGSVHDLLFHILRTDAGWRTGLETGQQPPPLRPEDFPDLPALQTGLADEQTAWQTLLDKLAPEQINSAVALTTRRGTTHTFIYWHILQHLILHGMQHHAELAHLLTAHGQPPGDLDFIFFV